MIKISKTIIMILLIIQNVFALSQDSWEKVKDKKGISIFTRTIQNSDFKVFRAEMHLEESIHAFVAVLRDMEHLHEWAYSIKYTNVLERHGDSVQVYYAEASTPFPFQNRDGIYHNQFRWIADSSKLVMDINLFPDYLEEKDNLVRVKGNGFWSAVITESELLHITFQMQVDPGGSIPAWLTNIFIDDTPYVTLSNLREIIKKEKYQNQEFDFIK